MLLHSLEEAFPNMWRAWGDSTGLHLAIEFPGMRFDDAFMKNGLQNGIRITTVDFHCIQKDHHLNKLLIGYGHLEPEEIQKGILLLQDFMRCVFAHR